MSALKVLMLKKELDEKRSILKDLRTTQNTFATREAELEESIKEAKTDEEKKTVNSAIEEFDADKKENEKQIGEVEAEALRIENEIKELEERSKTPTLVKESTGVNIKRKDDTIMNVRSFKTMDYEQRSAFVQREDVKEFLTRVRELKAQTRAVSGGELGIPEVVLGMLRDDVSRESKLIKYFTRKTVSGIARQNITGTIPEAVWTEMIASFNELDISFNQIEVDGYMVGGFIPVANSLLDDSSDINLFSEIYDTLVKAIALALDKAMLYGTGKAPTGIVTRLAQTAKPSDWGTKSPVWTDLHESNVLKLDLASRNGVEFFTSLVKALAVASNKYGSQGLFWAMNKKTHMDILTQTMSFNSAGSLVSSVNSTMPIIGGEIVELDFLPDYEIVGGYGCQYLLAERQGVTFKQSEHVKFLQNQTVFAASARYDGKPVKGEGFVLVNYHNTNPTTTVTFAGDRANVERVSLASLSIGEVTLIPPFSPDVLNYYCEVSNSHTQKVEAKALKSEATVSIKNGATPVENGKNATFTAGENILTVEVENNNAVKRTYSVVVKDTKS